MCKRMVINAGIERVVVRNTKTEYTVYDVQKDWVENDESIRGEFGY
jgi:dCMP deaminase